MEHFDAIVIGAGDAAMEVTVRAANAGHRVAVIYKDPYLGTCLNTGCNPSKFIIERAKVAQAMRTADKYHIESVTPVVDLAAMIDEKNDFVRSAREHSLDGARDSEEITLFKGGARFTGDHSIAVGDAELSAPRIFVATGMRPVMPPIEGLEGEQVLTNESLMDLRELPEHLVVLGGGYIAAELSQAYRRLGSEVTVVEMSERLCNGEEPEVSDVLRQAFEDEGIDIRLQTTVQSVEHVDGHLNVTVEGPDGDVAAIQGSHLLVAAGRRPNTDSLDLDRAGIDTNEAGFVVVDEYLKTSNPQVWAIGDVNGQQPFTRISQEEGKAAYRNSFEGQSVSLRREMFPHAIFTDPEVGAVGLSEADARDKGFDVEAPAIPADQFPRARLSGKPRGLVKFVVDRATRQILGCSVVAAGGAELIYGVVLVMRLGGTIDDLANATGVFPTMQEGIEGSARAVAGRIAHEQRDQ